MISHATCRRTLAPLLAATAVAATVQTRDAAAFERQDIACELKDLTRHISLRTDPDAGYVCDVLYEKPDEGGTREVLWSARNNIDYCEPRFEDFVQALASRGWTCDYAEGSDDGGDQPAMGAAEEGQTPDDETSGEGVKGAFRDQCLADVASSPSIEVSGTVKGYCNCLTDGMDSHGLSEGDAEVIFGGLSAMAAETDGDSNGDKRLNTLAANYESVAESCR